MHNDKKVLLSQFIKKYLALIDKKNHFQCDLKDSRNI